MRQRVEIFQKLEQNSSWGEKCLFLEEAVMGPFYSSGMPFTIVPWTSTKSLLGERSAFSWKMQWWDLFIPAECHLLLFPGHPPKRSVLYLCSDGKESACDAGGPGSIPGSGRMITHSSILVWRIPWTEEPGGLQPMQSQRVEHCWVPFEFIIYINILVEDIYLSMLEHDCFAMWC